MTDAKREAIAYLQRKISYPRIAYVNKGEREILRGIIQLLRKPLESGEGEESSRGDDKAMLGQVERCIKVLEAFIDIPDLQAHGEGFYTDTYGALLSFQRTLQKPTPPQTGEGELSEKVWQVLFDGKEALKFNKDEGSQDALADLARKITSLLLTDRAQNG